MDILTRSMLDVIIFFAVFGIMTTIFDKIAERKERKRKNEKEKEK